jgi:hypothetical protein
MIGVAHGGKGVGGAVATARDLERASRDATALDGLSGTPVGDVFGPDQLFAGSLVFLKPDGPVDRRDLTNWWYWVRGAQWRYPRGPGSSLEGLDSIRSST